MRPAEDDRETFYLQYFFPPSSVGETGRMVAAGRREIGHGKLAERALAPAVQALKGFPYNIRVESHVTESNGSNSMASVCGGCLAMLVRSTTMCLNVCSSMYPPRAFADCAHCVPSSACNEARSSTIAA